MNKYFRYYFRLFRMNVMEEMANRANFFTWVAIHIVSLLTYVAFFKILFAQVNSINGWTQYQVLLVLGTGTLITGLGSLTFFSFMYNFGRDLVRGDFDFKLTKPLDPHFLAAFIWVDLEDFTVVPIAIILIIYALGQIQPQNLPLCIFMFLVLLTSSMVLLFSLLTLIESLAFRFVRVDSARDLFWSIVTTGKYPAKSFANTSIITVIFLTPIALMSSVPAEVLFGRFEPLWILASLMLSTTLFVYSRRVFMRSLRSYSSASS